MTFREVETSWHFYVPNLQVLRVLGLLKIPLD